MTVRGRSDLRCLMMMMTMMIGLMKNAKMNAGRMMKMTIKDKLALIKQIKANNDRKIAEFGLKTNK